MVASTPSPFDSQGALRTLIRTPDLEARIAREPELLEAPLRVLEGLSREAWDDGRQKATGSLRDARLETQRALYELNRVRLYWGDDPDHYVNETSATLLGLHGRIEAPFQHWLERQVTTDTRLPACERGQPAPTSGAEIIRAWADQDRTPTPTPTSRWFAEEMNLSGYRQLLALGSLNGLVEASQLSRALGGAPNMVQTTLTRIFVEEYGAGRLAKKHSTYFATMLEQQGMSTNPEAYLRVVPWEVLAVINHAFYLAENKRHYLRFCGAFAYTEVSTPASFNDYARAATRLGLSDGRGDYWSLHVREDERHGAWMIDDVVLPQMQRYPERLQDILFGYAQQRVLEGMARAATARACLQAALALLPGILAPGVR